METPATLLGGLSPAQFLDEYWQKKPLLIRGALPAFESPVNPEDLAALAGEEEATARLILEEGGDYPWQLRYGPFTEEDFAGLPESRWTLLVQEVDRMVPEIARIRDYFRFIPSWRIDDVMISYAPAGGGVGAHTDSYDVFLLQAKGHRRWQINHTPVEVEHLIPDLDVRILADFEPDAEWVLAPGDMLYLPPRIAHYGVAMDDCMTFSIGFRAPGHQDILAGLVEYLAEHAPSGARYADPDLRPQLHPGEIGPAALAKVRDVLRQLADDEKALRSWFGRYMTEPRRGALPDLPEEEIEPAELARRIRDGARLLRSPRTRLAYVRHDNGETSLFAGGAEYRIPSTLPLLAPLLTGTGTLDANTLFPDLNTAATAQLLAGLVNDGHLELDDDSYGVV